MLFVSLNFVNFLSLFAASFAFSKAVGWLPFERAIALSSKKVFTSYKKELEENKTKEERKRRLILN